MSMGERLKSIRELKRLSCHDVDVLAELTPGHTSAIESGRRANPSVDTATRLARALDVGLDWLVNG